MAIAVANLGNSVGLGNNAANTPDMCSGTDATSYSNTSWTPPTSGLIVACMQASRAAGPDTPTMSGNGLTWTQIGTTLSAGSGRGLSLFGADASGSSAGVTTIDFGVNTQLGIAASFFHVTGVDLSGGVAAAFVQRPANSGTGTSGSITLTAASHADNRAFAFFWHNANEVSDPRTNWTEIDDLTGSAHLRGLISEWRSDTFETTASASWTTSTAWAGIAFELKAAASGTQTVNANAIASTETVYQPTVTTGGVTVSPNAIVSTATVYGPTVTSVATIVAAFIASTEAHYQPTITAGAVTVSPNFISSTAQVFAPTITTGAVVVALNTIASTATVFEPTVMIEGGTQTVNLNTIASTAQVFQPTVIAGAVTVSLTRIEATATVTQPTITTGAATVSPNRIESTEQFFAPVITVGVVTIAPNLIASTAIVYQPTVQLASVQTIDPNRIESTAIVYQVIVVLYTISVERTYNVPTEDRILAVASEIRTFEIAAESRVYTAN